MVKKGTVGHTYNPLGHQRGDFHTIKSDCGNLLRQVIKLQHHPNEVETEPCD